jgi:hypothetical protein
MGRDSLEGVCVSSRILIAMAALALPLAVGAVSVPAQARSEVFRCEHQEATIVGTPGNDQIHGTAGPDVIVGLGASDSIFGLGGNDVICGGGARDGIDGGTGNDRIHGNAGSDRLVGGAGGDHSSATWARSTTSKPIRATTPMPRAAMATPSSTFRRRTVFHCEIVNP